MAEFYTTGSLSVTSGQKAFEGSGTLWLPSNVKAGDLCNVAGQLMLIEAVTDATHGRFAVPWSGASASDLSYAMVKTSSDWGTNRSIAVDVAEMIRLLTTGQQFEWVIALSHEQSEISAQAAVLTVPVPKNIEVQSIVAWVNKASSSGNVVVDINLDGVSVFSQELTIEEDEQSSETAATPYVLVQPNWDRGKVLTVDFDTVGAGAEGAKLIISGQRRS
jgi:hypothetical protein